MKLLARLAVCAPLLLAGCAVSPKSFYADPSKPNATELCRLAFDQNADAKFRQDATNEILRRGLTEQDCRNKIATQNAVAVAAVLVGVGATAAIACQNGCGGGGGYVPNYSAGGYGYDWDYLPGSLQWRCRSRATGEFAPDYDCASSAHYDHWS